MRYPGPLGPNGDSGLKDELKCVARVDSSHRPFAPEARTWRPLDSARPSEKSLKSAQPKSGLFFVGRPNGMRSRLVSAPDDPYRGPEDQHPNYGPDYDIQPASHRYRIIPGGGALGAATRPPRQSQPPSVTCARSRELPDGYYGPPGRARPAPGLGPDEARGLRPFPGAMAVP